MPHAASHLAVSPTHILAANANTVSIVNYAAPKDASGLQLTRVFSQPGDSVVFHISDVLGKNATSIPRYKATDIPTGESSAITAVAVSLDYALVACESGVVFRYTVKQFAFVDRIQTGVMPVSLSFNCDSTAMAVLDVNGGLSLWGAIEPAAPTEKEATAQVDPQEAPQEATVSHPDLSKQSGVTRKDVWQVIWAADAPCLLAITERSRLSVLRAGRPEEPISSSARLVAFSDLKLTAVLPELLSARPSPSAGPVQYRDALREFETKTLRDLKAILQNIPDLVDASAFVEQFDHPRLWRLLAEAALERLDLSAAERAFAKVRDYRGLQFTRRLRQIDDKAKQHAEVCSFFGAFDEAERIYLELDRADLAIDLRRRLGDSFRVLQLVKDRAQGGAVGAILADIVGGSGTGAAAGSEAVRAAHQFVAEYLRDRGRWNLALEHFRIAGDLAQLAEALFMCEQYQELTQLGLSVPAGSALCVSIGQQLAAIGLSKEAVEVHLRGPEAVRVKNAIDCCVQLSEWATAVRLANEYQYPQTETLLARYADSLAQKGQILQSCELYIRAGRHLQAATLLREVAANWSLTGKFAPSPSDIESATAAKAASEKTTEPSAYTLPLLRSPETLKMIHLLAALQVQSHREESLKTAMISDDNNGNAHITSLNAQGPTRQKGGGSLIGMASMGGPASKKDAVATLLAAEQQTMVASATKVGATKMGGGGMGGGGSDTPWRGVEAVHLYMLCHGSLRRNSPDDAMRIAARLVEYEEIIPPRISYSLLALAAVRRGLWGVASQAFTRLESAREVPEAYWKGYSDLAIKIFTKERPVNPRPSAERPQLPCPECRHLLDDWAPSCDECGHNLPFCVLTGRTIFTKKAKVSFMSDAVAEAEASELRVDVKLGSDQHIGHPQQSEVVRCSVCKHFCFKVYMGRRKCCPLCRVQISRDHGHVNGTKLEDR